MNTSTNGGGPRVLLSRTTINQNARNALRSLVEHRMLAEFCTLFSWNTESIWNRLLPGEMRTQLARRSISEAPAARIRTFCWREGVRLGVRGTPFDTLLCSGERPFSTVRIDRSFDERVARRVNELRPNAVYAYDGAALITFREARKHGIIALQELSTSYWKWWQKLVEEEAECNPDFADLLPASNSSERVEWREEELRLADYIFVPSEHVRRTLAGVVPEEKIRVVVYGAPMVRPRARHNIDPTQPLKVLFVGSLSQRKGISYLLQAIDMLGSQVDLTLIVGRIAPNARVDEACRRWRWFETLPHAQVLEVMQQADVLVLPSLWEGCALVVLEALACGLPVIVTPNTGSSAFVRDGQEGFVVPIRRPEAMAERLELIHRNREMLVQMSHKAQAAAAEHSWEEYRAAWVDAMRSVAC